MVAVVLFWDEYVEVSKSNEKMTNNIIISDVSVPMVGKRQIGRQLQQYGLAFVVSLFVCQKRHELVSLEISLFDSFE
jgi:hypothetical protein